MRLDDGDLSQLIQQQNNDRGRWGLKGERDLLVVVYDVLFGVEIALCVISCLLAPNRMPTKTLSKTMDAVDRRPGGGWWTALE